MPIHRNQDRPQYEGLFWLSGAVFLVASLFFVFLVYLWVVGPREVERTKSWEIEESSVIEWMSRSVEAEVLFEQNWADAPADPDVFDSLEQALEYQFKLRAVDLDDSFGSISRLNHLLRRLEDTKGKMLFSKSRAYTDRASQFMNLGDAISAVPLLEEALKAQEWINSHLPDSDLVDMGEVARIQHLLERLEAMDVSAEVESLVAKGNTSFEEGQWEDSKAFYERALVLQESINLNMPDSSLVRWRLVQELKENQRRLEAAEMNERIEDLLATSVQANDSIERALKLQALVNDRYPNTVYYNRERFEQLRGQLASDQSQANIALLFEQVAQLELLLNQNQWATVGTALLEIEGSLKEFELRFSLNLLPDPSLKQRIDWMIKHLGDLHHISKRVNAGLVQHPTLKLSIFKAEVDQLFYLEVMGQNPSRWIGDNYPVDSVGFYEANEFCKLLSWSLGKQVQLPQQEWLSEIDSSALKEDELWFSGRSDFRSQPVGTSQALNGLYDLYGNLAEWVHRSEEGADVFLFGGSGADTWSQMRKKPLIIVAPNFRSRWTGFRFCVLD
jgi:tetratricopeptide (TPR) repeat protein